MLYFGNNAFISFTAWFLSPVFYLSQDCSFVLRENKDEDKLHSCLEYDTKCHNHSIFIDSFGLITQVWGIQTFWLFSQSGLTKFWNASQWKQNNVICRCSISNFEVEACMWIETRRMNNDPFEFSLWKVSSNKTDTNHMRHEVLYYFYHNAKEWETFSTIYHRFSFHFSAKCKLLILLPISKHCALTFRRKITLPWNSQIIGLFS